MSNDVTLFGGTAQLPDYLRDIKTDAITDSLAGKGFGKRISIRGNVFRMVVDGEEVAVSEDRAINVVIVAAAPAIARVFYGETYVEGQSVPPSCWSQDGVKPDFTAKNRQSETCATCPQNISGSGQGDTRACRYSQRIAVVLDGDIGGNVYQVSLPSLSIFGKGENGKLPLQAYAKFLKGHGVPVSAVVTEMRFDINSATPKLYFKAIRPLSEAEYKLGVKQGATEDAKNAVTFTVAQIDGVVDAPIAAPVSAQPSSKPATEKQDSGPKPTEKKGFKVVKTPAEPEAVANELAVAESAAEPVKKQKVTPPAGKKDLTSILDQWADDAE